MIGAASSRPGSRAAAGPRQPRPRPTQDGRPFRSLPVAPGARGRDPGPPATGCCSGHGGDDVIRGLEVAHRPGPEARLPGDDWMWAEVRRAARDFAAKRGFRVEIDLNG